MRMKKQFWAIPSLVYSLGIIMSLLPQACWAQDPAEIGFKDIIVGVLTMPLVAVESETFKMGRRRDGDDLNYGASTESPQHFVTLTPFSIGTYEVTNAEYAEVLNWANAKGYLRDSEGEAYAGGDAYGFGKRLIRVLSGNPTVTYKGGEFGAFSAKARETLSMKDHPVVQVSWFGAVTFCNWFSEMAGLSPCYDLNDFSLLSPLPNGYRLPTEAEWEWAASWNAEIPRHWTYGYQNDTIGAPALNYQQTNELELTTRPFTTPVGYYDGVNKNTAYSASHVGCFDMSGNVIEWCHDWYDSKYYRLGDQTDPTGPETGTQRVHRGGAWNNLPIDCRTASRGASAPSDASVYIGFRVARTGIDAGK